MGQRVLGFLGRHKIAVAGALIAADLVANVFGVAPIQLTTRPDPRAVVVEARAFPGAALTLYSHPCRSSAASVLLPAEIRGAEVPNAPFAYRAAIDAYIADEQAAIAAHGLVQRPENRSIALFHAREPKGLMVFFHGLDDGPAQGKEIMDLAYSQGWDVFAPDLPGHGLQTPDGKDDIRFIPGAANHEDWQRFEDRVFTLVRSSKNVHVVGLSAGGMLALQLAERHGGDLGPDGRPVIQRVLAFSPLLNLAGDFKLKSGETLKLSRIHFTNEQAAEALGTAECLFGAPVDGYLKAQAVDMKGPNPPTAYGTRYIDQDVVLGLVINADATKQNAANLKAVPKGVEVVVSMADDVVNPSTNLAFAKRIGAETYVFPKDQGVPHAMIHQPENPNAASLAAVRDIVARDLSR